MNDILNNNYRKHIQYKEKIDPGSLGINSIFFTYQHFIIKLYCKMATYRAETRDKRFAHLLQPIR